MWDSSQVATLLQGTLQGSPSVPWIGCAIDSRKVTSDVLFAAVPGQNTDGHRFIPQAFEAGAGIVLAESSRIEEAGEWALPHDRALILVEDTVQALQALAKAWREALACPVVAITGSSGKTTTKDMVAAVLAEKYIVHCNPENYNNEIGLPLTLLNAPAETQILVLEMGMRGLGQIKALCQICSPDIGVITNIGTTHLELLGSQENIAQAKWELIDSLSLSGTAILNGEDEYSAKKAQQEKRKKIIYGLRGTYLHPDLVASKIAPQGTMETSFQVQYQGEEAKVFLPLPGEHHVLDALAALAVGRLCGISLEKGAVALENFERSKMRLEVLSGIFGSTLINDVYNANPASMKASLRVLAERGGGNTIGILGEMYELGESAVSGHREVGQLAAQLGIGELVTVGQLAKETARGALEAGMPVTQIHICEENSQAVERTRLLLEINPVASWILIKGSRGMRMENITEQLRKTTLPKPSVQT